MKNPTTMPSALATCRDSQTYAWHELRLAMRRFCDMAEPAIDELDLLRGALAEYVMAARAIETAPHKEIVP